MFANTLIGSKFICSSGATLTLFIQKASRTQLYNITYIYATRQILKYSSKNVSQFQFFGFNEPDRFPEKSSKYRFVLWPGIKYFLSTKFPFLDESSRNRTLSCGWVFQESEAESSFHVCFSVSNWWAIESFVSFGFRYHRITSWYYHVYLSFI